MSPQVYQYLRNCGLSEKRIANCRADTRLYHDLRVYGDIAEACLEMLRDEYQVDFRGFKFEEYFPPEFMGNNVFTSLFYSMVPFASYYARKRREYSPFTLNMIESLMQSKRWSTVQ
jgi:hypothetical protein